MFTACAGQANRVIFIPDPTWEQQEQIDPFDSWHIIESINGPGHAGIPEWVRRYYYDRFHGIESLEQHSGNYVFVGESRGGSYNALVQWANGFTAEQDLPRLIAARAERRLLLPASLYPDDEYGQFFENLIRRISDGEFSGAVKGEVFWLKRRIIIRDEESDIEDQIPQESILERYEFLVPFSINQEILQEQLRNIMSGIKMTVAPTREQTARISRIQQTFFEEF